MTSSTWQNDKNNLAKLAGIGYLAIFFLAIFANFFMLESLREVPLQTLEHHQTLVRSGIMAFLLTAVLDVIVAWALFELYKAHPLTTLSTWFRLIHAVIMGIAVFALVKVTGLTTEAGILEQVALFNTIWLIGLFFFGFHLLLLGIITKAPQWINLMLIVAGMMYIADTNANFLMENYQDHADLFLTLVAIPSILGEMSFALWLLIKASKK